MIDQNPNKMVKSTLFPPKNKGFEQDFHSLVLSESVKLKHDSAQWFSNQRPLNWVGRIPNVGFNDY